MITANVAVQVFNVRVCAEWLMRCLQTCVITGPSPHLVESHPVVMVLLRCFLCVTCTSQHGRVLTNMSPALLTGRHHIVCFLTCYSSNSPLVFYTPCFKNIELFHTQPFVTANSKFYTACPQHKRLRTWRKTFTLMVRKNVFTDFSGWDRTGGKKKSTSEQTTCAPAPFSTTITNEAHGKKEKKKTWRGFKSLNVLKRPSKRNWCGLQKSEGRTEDSNLQTFSLYLTELKWVSGEEERLQFLKCSCAKRQKQLPSCAHWKRCSFKVPKYYST